MEDKTQRGAPPLHEDLREIALLHGLPDAQLQELAGQLHGKSFPGDTTLMTVEQPGDVVYFIRSGTVKVHIEQEDGTDVILAILGHGETVGEMSVLDEHERAASVVTLEESALLWLNRTAFRASLLTMPVAYNLACLLSSRLRHANEQIQSLATCGAEARIARHIMAFAQKYGRPEGGGGLLIPIRLTQSDIASLTGISREHTNKILVSYKERGYLTSDRRHYFTIHNSDALVRRCQ